MRTTALYDAAATRALDRVAIDDFGIAGIDLMQRAGQAAFDALRQRYPDTRRVIAVCGTGNNGGDGFVVARLAHEAGLAAQVHVVGDMARVAGDARTCLDAAAAAGLVPAALADTLQPGDVIVDALFGTGLDREVGGAAAAAIDWINASGRSVLAIDLPSGLDAGSGRVLGSAVRADLTVTFIGLKQGLLTGAAPALCGEIVFAGLGLPPACRERVAATARRLDYDGVRSALAPRARTAHKGEFGHVLVIGGAPGYAGAARMAAEAAARSGAGLVSLATHPAHAALIAANRPEIMVHGVSDGAALRRLAARASVIAIGPGLGQAPWARELFAAVRELNLPQVVDADGLNLLAADPEPHAARVLTPHPGEAARLLDTTSAVVQRDRFGAVRALCERYGGVALLKGAGTLVQTAGELPVVIAGGNPGMASGGMGDVLTGIVAGFLAQHFAPLEAAAVGACVHAEAADRAAAAGGERGLLAGDVLDYLRAAVNPAP